MTNPLIAKWEELNKKKEPPKFPKIEDCVGEETIADELKKSNFIKAKNPKISFKSFDRDDLKVSFQQVVDKIQQGKAQVASMSMERDIMSIMRNKIIFEVYVDDL
jgi:hypothetical protein